MRKVIIALSALILSLGATATFGAAAVDRNPDVAVGDVDAKLVRNNNVLSVSGTLYGLAPNETYTVWWITIDNTLLVLNATGGISNSAGELHFAAALPAGTYDGSGGPRQVLVPGSLDDPHSALVIFDVISHGPPIPGRINEQISTIDGACDVFACDLVASFAFAP